MAGPTTSARLSGTFRPDGNIPPACLAENNHFTDVRISGYSTEFLNSALALATAKSKNCQTKV